MPHYPPATYYPTILPHSRCTRGEGSRPKKDSFREGETIQNDRKESWRKKKKNVEKEMLKETLYIYIYSLLNIISRGDDEIKNGWTLIHTYIYVYIYIYVYTYIYKYTYNIILSVSRGWNNWVWREKKKKICIFFSHLVAYICIQLEYIKRLRE